MASKRQDEALQDGARLVQAIAAETLRSFELLKALATIGVAGSGLTMALRAMLEDLYLKGPRTVPQIAAGRTMTRQSIQASVDQLRAMALAEARPNPAHRRSPVIALTPAGVAAFEAIRERELERLGSLAPSLAGHDLEAALAALAAFRSALEARLEERRRAANG